MDQLADRKLAFLDAAVRAVCPIEGLSLGEAGNFKTLTIQYHAKASPEEQRAGQLVVDAFDGSDEAQANRDIEILHATLFDDPRFKAMAGAVIDAVTQQIQSAVSEYVPPTVETLMEAVKTSAMNLGAKTLAVAGQLDRVIER